MARDMEELIDRSGGALVIMVQVVLWCNLFRCQQCVKVELR